MSDNLLLRIAARLDKFSEATCRLTAWLALLLVVVTFSVVVLRYLFDVGSIALQESTLYLHASLFMFGAAYTLKANAHVRVDIFYRKLTARQKALVNLTGTLLLLLPFCGFLLWVSWDYVAVAWALREGSREAGGLPLVYLLKTLIPLGAILLALQGVSLACRSLVTVTGTAKGEQT
jgi:TRAP-type mannitol/chloroaromatic compound transport system permease small subunit